MDVPVAALCRVWCPTTLALATGSGPAFCRAFNVHQLIGNSAICRSTGKASGHHHGSVLRLKYSAFCRLNKIAEKSGDAARGQSHPYSASAPWMRDRIAEKTRRKEEDG
jgi:hypothetical protein